MKAVEIAWGLGAAIVAAGCVWTVPVQADTKAEQVSAAKSLVEETLRREATDGVDDRGELLKPAIAMAPRYEPPYWQSGFIFDLKRKEWLAWDDVQQRAAKDDRLVKYRQARERHADSIDSQLELARWCRDHKMPDQAKAHLSRVLEINPNQAEARQELGFKMVKGAWVNDHDAADSKAATRKASAGASEWVARLEKIRDRLTSDKTTTRDKARKELQEISDPNAAEAIDTVFCGQSADMSLVGIGMLQRIRSPQAAAALAWHAAFSPWPQVAQAAATALQAQTKYDYVPLLLHAAEMVDYQAAVASNSYNPVGSSRPVINMLPIYRVDHVVDSQSSDVVEHLTKHPRWQDVNGGMRFNPYTPDPVAKHTGDVVNQGDATITTKKREYYTITNDRLQDRHTETTVTTDKAVKTQVGAYIYPRYGQMPGYPSQSPQAPQPQTGASSVISDASATRNWANSACAALAVATGERGPASPSEWWDWWYDFNEVYQSNGKRPDRAVAKTSIVGGIQSQRGDCLGAGTLVCAESGPTAIEEIAVGDRIFCCDPETGCLALKPVLRKTVRPEGSLLKITAGGEQFQSNGGHAVWVAGQGWIKARDLREGMQLHTIRGTVAVESIEQGESQKSLSLVAADFHTFYVGKDMILTHDNTIRPPTDRIVPGLADKAVRHDDR